MLMESFTFEELSRVQKNFEADYFTITEAGTIVFGKMKSPSPTIHALNGATIRKLLENNFYE